MKKSFRYFRTFIAVCWDVVKNKSKFIRVPIHNLFLPFRRKPKQKVFDESDPYFEPYKNDHA